jgi:hypothetical protein
LPPKPGRRPARRSHVADGCRADGGGKRAWERGMQPELRQGRRLCGFSVGIPADSRRIASVSRRERPLGSTPVPWREWFPFCAPFRCAPGHRSDRRQQLLCLL